MNETDWFRSHVERCLQDGCQVPQVIKDEDGDYAFRYGSAACFVSITEDEVPTFVRVVALAVSNVKRSARLMVELNDINARMLTGRIYWAGGSILVEEMLIAEAVSADSLDHACTTVGMLADRYGLLLAGGFDGRTPYDAEDELDDAATDS